MMPIVHVQILLSFNNACDCAKFFVHSQEIIESVFLALIFVNFSNSNSWISISSMKNRSGTFANFKNRSSESVHLKKRSTAILIY